jgi:hypothetical protein
LFTEFVLKCADHRAEHHRLYTPSYKDGHGVDIGVGERTWFVGHWWLLRDRNVYLKAGL